MAAGDHVKTLGSDQHKTTSTTLTITIPAGGVAAGNTVFVGVEVTGQDADVVSGVADSGLNTYTLDESEAPLNGGSADPKAYLYRGAIITPLAQNDTIVVTLAASTNARGKAAVADEYEGTATKDQSTSAAGTSTTPNSGNVTTTSAVETMIGVFGGGGVNAPVGDSPWVDRTERNTTGGAAATNGSVGLSEQITASTGTFAYSATVAASQAWRALISTYTFAAGGQTVAVGQASEAETAGAITPVKPILVDVGQAGEVESANAITPAQPILVTVGQASEIEAANAITPVKPIVMILGQASEVESAGTLTPRQPIIVAVGQAIEIESASLITPVQPGAVVIGQASETETANPITPQQAIVVEIGQANEVESAGAMMVRQAIVVPIGQAGEVELALVVTPSTGGVLLVAIVCQIAEPTVTCATLEPTVACGISAPTVTCG